MRRKSKEEGGSGSRLLDKWLRGGRSLLSHPKVRGFGRAVGRRLPKKLQSFDFDFRKVELNDISAVSKWIRLGLLVLGVLLLAQLTDGVIGLFLRPTYPKFQAKREIEAPVAHVAQDTSGIERRNMFNVEGTIPEPFEAGQLDCMSQAKLTNEPIELLGTIVMTDPAFSVALIQSRGNSLRIGVKKDEVFLDGKYQALKIERRRLCFQIRSTQDLEYIEIPEEGGSHVASLTTGGSGGIRPTAENKYEVSGSYLDEKILNLTEILKTARAAPHMDPATGKFGGFLIQTIDPESPFAELGLRPGDVLKGVNNINLDNQGKALEAFNTFRNQNFINLKVTRGGRDMNIEYAVKR